MLDAGRFETWLADLSTRIAGLAPDAIDAAIDATLREVVAHFGTDRSTLAHILPETGAMSVSHSWARDGERPAAVALSLPGRFPHYHERLRRGETIRHVRILDELPPDAAAERAYARELPIVSHVGVPLSVGGRWVASLFTAMAHVPRAWTDEDVRRLRIVGQILADAVHRRDIERALGDHVRELDTLRRRLEAENRYLREEIDGEAGFEHVVGRSRAMRDVLERAAQVAPTHATVLLLGETGTGKGVLASAIHARSRRAARALIKVNCAALPASLVESELFGHEKGAFTGATAAKPGRFELADGGTLFLDEVGELAPDVQAKLLRVLQDGEFERVGAVRTRKVDVRVVAATNRDLERAMQEGRFREDLYYRIAVFPIRVPPLRERPEDVPLLVWELLEKRGPELDRRIDHVPDTVMQALQRYGWPGNVRELANVVERAMITSPGTELRLDPGFAGPARREAPGESLHDVERAHLLRVLERCAWRITGPGNAADRLGMKPSTLRSRLNKLGIERPAQAPAAAAARDMS